MGINRTKTLFTVVATAASTLALIAAVGGHALGQQAPIELAQGPPPGKGGGGDEAARQQQRQAQEAARAQAQQQRQAQEAARAQAQQQQRQAQEAARQQQRQAQEAARAAAQQQRQAQEAQRQQQRQAQEAQRQQQRQAQEAARAQAQQQRQAQERARAQQEQQRRQAQDAQRQQQRQAQEAARAAERQQRQAQEKAQQEQRRQAQEQQRRQAEDRGRQQQQQQAREQQQRKQAEDAVRQQQEQQRQARERNQQEQQRKMAEDAARQQQQQQQRRPGEHSPQELQRRQAEDAARHQQEQLRQAPARNLLEQQRKQAEDAVRQQQEQQRQARERPGPGPAPEGIPLPPRDQRERAGRDGAADPNRLADRVLRLEDVQRRRERRAERGGEREVIREPGNRTIVRERNRAVVRHDETERFSRTLRSDRVERSGALTRHVYSRADGADVISERDNEGRTLRRYKRWRDGRIVVLFDNRRYYSRIGGDYFFPVVDLAPVTIGIPYDEYIVSYDSVSVDELYDTLSAPPVEELDRTYSLEEVRYSVRLRERMRRVDLTEITFETGSWEITPDQMPKLEKLARAMLRVIERRADEVFLIEGHTDAVGSDIDNLSLSDRRAEAVAVALAENFNVPAENLVTQGYGEEQLKVETEAASRINRRVSVRRITPLLDKEQGPAAAGASRGEPRAGLRLGQRDRAFILGKVDRRAESRLGLGSLQPGDPLPRGVSLWSFPQTVLERIPELRRHKYFVFEGDVVVVDPESSQIVMVIEDEQ